MIISVAAAGIMVVAVLLKFWASIQLMSGYRVEDYLSTPKAKRLYWAAALAPLVAGAAILALAFATSIWWVEAAAAVFGAFIAYGTARRLWMRFSGRYEEFYRQRQWR